MVFYRSGWWLLVTAFEGAVNGAVQCNKQDATHNN
jgi:hypothetical protein